MVSAPSWKGLATVALFISGSLAGSVSTCPTDEVRYVSGSDVFHLCQDTDYSGTTLYDYHNLPSAQACADKCQQYNGCAKAVWDNVGLALLSVNGAVWTGGVEYSDTILDRLSIIMAVLDRVGNIVSRACAHPINAMWQTKSFSREPL